MEGRLAAEHVPGAPEILSALQTKTSKNEKKATAASVLSSGPQALLTLPGRNLRLRESASLSQLRLSLHPILALALDPEPQLALRHVAVARETLPWTK